MAHWLMGFGILQYKKDETCWIVVSSYLFGVKKGGTGSSYKLFRRGPQLELLRYLLATEPKIKLQEVSVLF